MQLVEIVGFCSSSSSSSSSSNSNCSISNSSSSSSSGSFLPVALRPNAAMDSFTRFLDHMQRRIAVGLTLDELSARRRDLYLTK